jgi:hypothetical protein
VYVRKKLRDRRAAPHHPGLQPTLRQGAEQVKQDSVVPIPGVQQGLEQALVVCCRHHNLRSLPSTFQECLKPLLDARRLPREAIEDLETNLTMIQSVLWIARNDAGHPTAMQLQREQVYVYLQLFVPFARQVMKLRNALS